MKKLFRLAFIMLGLLMLVVASALAQSPTPVENPFEPGTSVSQVFNWFTVIYGSVITLLTYLQGAIKSPFLAKVKTPVKYLIIAGVVAALFLTQGWANALGIVIGFVGSAITYDKVLVPLGLKTGTNT